MFEMFALHQNHGTKILVIYAPKIPNYAQIPCISQGMKKNSLLVDLSKFSKIMHH